MTVSPTARWVTGIRSSCQRKAVAGRVVDRVVEEEVVGIC